MNVFRKLRPEIRGLLASRGISEPTPPQTLAIPKILAGDNLLLIAPTGTGKTEAAALPIFHSILRSKAKGADEGVGILALYATPLRALNRDMLRRFQDWGAELGISVAVRHGDTTKSERRRQALHPPDLLITTPETLQVMLTGKLLRQNLSRVKSVVIDEVHELAASKRGSQLAVVLERLVEVAGEFQRIGLSATVGTPEVVAEFLVGPERQCRIVQAEVKRESIFKVICPRPAKKDFALARELECDPALATQISQMRQIMRRNKSLIFVNTRQAAEVLGSRFRQLGEQVGVHHGSLSKEARVDAEEAFKRGDLQGLICTSSMELGIDIGDVDHVIQYSSPREVSRLVQRVGRAGHKMGMTAIGTIIATGPDDIAEAGAISRRAHEVVLEEIRPHMGSADVLANQLVGMTLDFGNISLDRAHRIITRSYPFKDTTLEELKEVAAQIEEHRLVWPEKDTVGRRRKSWEYYYQNLSMIPDEKRYRVFDIVSRKPIGTLDEAFVINFARPGATFVARGEIWEVVEIEDDEIKVAPIQRSGEIPSWTGEEIPVPWEVAQEVGEIREGIGKILEKEGAPAAVSMLVRRYPVDEEAASVLVDLIKSQLDAHLPVPDHRSILVESDGPEIVINACFGHKTNETLARVLTALLSARFGSSVGMEVDPYRIGLVLPKALLAEEVAARLMEIDPAHVNVILEKTLKNTTLFRWKMVHVARKFGALRKDIDYQKVNLRRILGVFEDTPLYEETLREIFHDRLDLRRAEEVLVRIRTGEIDVFTSGPTPIGSAGRKGGRDITSPERADGTVIELLKDRIMNDRVLLFCVSCKRWRSLRMVKNVPERPECPLCGSRMVAALKPWEEEEIKVVKKPEDKKTPEEKRRTKRVYRNANLVLSYGKTAAVVLASRGLGPETAARVMRKMRRDEEEFYRDILRAERNYARTKRFWG